MSLVLSFVRKASVKRNLSNAKDVFTEDEDMQLFSRQWRQKPQFTQKSTLEYLCENTRFTKNELKKLYRSFKEAFPTGYVSEEYLKDFLKTAFPAGDPEQYSSLLFEAFDLDKNGLINFIDFTKSLSQLTSDSSKSQLEWIFNLYDIDQDGLISYSDMLSYLRALYTLDHLKLSEDTREQLVQRHITFIFEKFGRTQERVIDRKKFLSVLEADPSVIEALKANNVGERE